VAREYCEKTLATRDFTPQVKGKLIRGRVHKIPNQYRGNSLDQVSSRHSGDGSAQNSASGVLFTASAEHLKF